MNNKKPGDRVGKEPITLIVGAGPVGLFLAGELVRRGMPCRIIDAAAGPSTTSKALGVMPRTLEIMQMIGLADRFVSSGQACPNVEIATPSRTLAAISFAGLPSNFPFIAMVPQNTTEAILSDRLRELGTPVEYGTKLVGFEQRPDSVVATLETRTGREDIEAAYMCGCDGARSTVRTGLSIPFVGSEYPDRFVLADLILDIDLSEETLFLYPGKTGPLAIFPMGGGRRRIVAVAEKNEGDVTESEILELFAKRGPRLRGIREIIWTSRFSIHRRSASSMRDRRVFLLGDAAHIHSPFGAQGMNTGLQDAWNLAWKFASVGRQRSPESLLETYQSERLRVAHNVIRQTDGITRIMASPNPVVNALRSFIVPKLSKTDFFKRTFTHLLSEIAVNYAHSPIVRGDGARVTQESLGIGGAPGRLDRSLADGKFVAVMPAATRSDRVHAAATHFHQHFGDAVAVIHSSGTSRTDRLEIVRPDGYRAAALASNDVAGATEVLRRQLTSSARG